MACSLFLTSMPRKRVIVDFNSLSTGLDNRNEKCLTELKFTTKVCIVRQHFVQKCFICRAVGSFDIYIPR